MKLRLIATLMMIGHLPMHADNLDTRRFEDFFPRQASFTMKIVEIENRAEKRFFEFEGSLKNDTLYLLVATQPRVMRGWVQLRSNDTIFSYNREADIVQQTSAESSFLQSLFSQEDIMTIRLQTLYKIDTISSFSDGGYPRLRVVFRPKSSRYSYSRIESTYDATTMYPLSRLYFSTEGQLVKSMVVTHLQFDGENLRGYEFIMADNLRSGYYARVRFEDWNSNDLLPDSLFTQASMRFLAK